MSDALVITYPGTFSGTGLPVYDGGLPPYVPLPRIKSTFSQAAGALAANASEGSVTAAWQPLNSSAWEVTADGRLQISTPSGGLKALAIDGGFADGIVQVTLGALIDQNANAGPAGRFNADGTECIRLSSHPTKGYEIYRMTAGATTGVLVSSNPARIPVQGDVAALRFEGTTIQAIVNGEVILTATNQTQGLNRTLYGLLAPARTSGRTWFDDFKFTELAALQPGQLTI